MRITGGTQAPPRPGPYPVRNRRRPRSPRQEEIMAAAQGAKRRVRASGRATVGNAMQPGLGRQLSRRVQSGAISQGQAQRTAGQRNLLERAFGSDWRVKVFGDRGYAQRTRQAAAKEPGNPRVAALNTALMERRKRMLAKAQERFGRS